MNKIRKTLEQIEAYKKVVDSYRFDNLNTVKWGFDIKDVPPTPQSLRRLKLENRLFQWGYSQRTFESEVTKLIQSNQPGEKREKFQKQLLEAARKRSNYVIDRRTTDEAMRKEAFEFDVSPRKDVIVETDEEDNEI